jgi:hypothetical protein
VPDIKLTPYELMQAGQVGLMRRVSSIKEGYDKNKHATISDWATDIDGAAAEMAVAKHLGIYWSGHVRSFKAADTGPFQVRSTSHRNGCLILRRNDSPNESYALVVSSPPIYSIVGLMLASDGMVNRYWRNDAWWIPQSDLTHKW